MIRIYGDSHSIHSFRPIQESSSLTLSCKHTHTGLAPTWYTHIPVEHCKHYYAGSTTMHRIGRDNIIIGYDKNEVNTNDIVVLSYGEIDCRCHIHRQINDNGRNEDDVIHELTHNYFRTIRNNRENQTTIIVGVIPPTKRLDFESLNGPILHELPFVGTDEDRSRYTKKVNALLEELSNKHGYHYFNPYSHYMREDGTLKYELSDSCVHLGDAWFFLDRFIELYTSISCP